MRASVRARVGIWLLLVTALVAISGFALLEATKARLEDQATDSLEQLAQLERHRLIGELDEEQGNVTRLARNPRLIATYFDGGAARNPNFGLESLLETTQLGGQDYSAFRLVDRAGNTIEETEDFQLEPDFVANEAMDQLTVKIGHVNAEGRLGFVAPVVSVEGEVLGGLIVEADITQLVWLSSRYESFGETSEAFVYQVTSEGNCQLLTNLRFDQSATFSSLNGEFATGCDDLSEDRSLRQTDYRGVDTFSAWTSVSDANWGLVVKMDDSDVFQILKPIQQTILASGFVAAVMLIGGWYMLVRPIGTRLSRTARSAEQLASGNYNALINDGGSDEIGRMADSMDRLARDLDQDIKRRRKAEAELRIRADYDGLTGLMNRHRMNSRLKELDEAGLDFSVVFLDLDGFKQINDTYGHSIGDDVLRLVATRTAAALEHAVIPGELGRWGGDEFVVLCPGSLEADLEDLVIQIENYFESPFRTRAGRHTVGISIGVADTSNDDSVEAIMSKADESMYRMKRRRNGRTRLSPQALKLVEDALSDDRVETFLQPLVFLDDDGSAHLFGAEALVRIRNEDGTLAMPDSFLPGIGSSAQALALDLRVLSQAATAAAAWHRQELVPPNFYISANFGAAAMADARLAEKIQGTLRRCGLAPEHLVVEIPETAEEVEAALVKNLRAGGILTAIDDVGCQYSNLGRLVDIPADIAKIDRRWLPNKDSKQSSKVELLKGLVDQCHMLDLAVIIEGIETHEQLQLVRSLGVDRVQGYLFGKPGEIANFEKLWGRPGGTSVRVAYDKEVPSLPEKSASTLDIKL